ncbi:MAG: hypothetical protein V1872_09900 [bacterium]
MINFKLQISNLIQKKVVYNKTKRLLSKNKVSPLQKIIYSIAIGMINLFIILNNSHNFSPNAFAEITQEVDKQEITDKIQQTFEAIKSQGRTEIETEIWRAQQIEGAINNLMEVKNKFTQCKEILLDPETALDIKIKYAQNLYNIFTSNKLGIKIPKEKKEELIEPLLKIIKDNYGDDNFQEVTGNILKAICLDSDVSYDKKLFLIDSLLNILVKQNINSEFLNNGLNDKLLSPLEFKRKEFFREKKALPLQNIDKTDVISVCFYILQQAMIYKSVPVANLLSLAETCLSAIKNAHGKKLNYFENGVPREIKKIYCFLAEGFNKVKGGFSTQLGKRLRSFLSLFVVKKKKTFYTSKVSNP